MEPEGSLSLFWMPLFLSEQQQSSVGLCFLICDRSVGTVDNHGNHGNRDFRQMPWMPWFCQYAVILPCFFAKMRSFTFSQEYFVFKQHNFGVYCVNLTPKYLPFLCLCYQNSCALLLTGGICNGDVIVVCILPRVYIFSGVGNHEFYQISSYYALPWFCRDFYDFHKSVPCFFAIFLPWFSTVPTGQAPLYLGDDIHLVSSTIWSCTVPST